MIHNPQRHWTSYEFTFDDLNGPLNDPESNKAVYILLTPPGRFGRQPTTVTRRDGELLAEIQWGLPLSFKAPKVTMSGRSVGDMLAKRKDGIWKNKWVWRDGHGREFWWRDLVCYNSEDQPVAEYTRQVEHYADLNDKAKLSVDNAYAPLMDYILVTALLMEMKRKDHEVAFGRRSQPPARRPRAYSANADGVSHPAAKPELGSRRRVGTL